jgi:conjugal transfer/entry exclusion protein
MARETVAQRNARYAQERETYLANQVAEYPARLMNVLARATNAYFELTVSDNKFQVQPRDRYDRTVTLAYAHSPNSQEQLETLEWELDRYEQAFAEAKRVAEVKKEALRKVNELLTAEERTLLNL